MDPVNTIDGDVRVLDETGADVLADTGQELDDAVRQRRRLAAPRPACHAIAGVCSAGFRIDGVAGDERGDGHPARDGEREVPRRDHRGDALALVARADCVSPGGDCTAPPLRRAAASRGRSTRRSRWPRTRRRRPGPTACPPRTPRGRRAGRAVRASTPRRGTARRPARPPACVAMVLPGPPRQRRRRRRAARVHDARVATNRVACAGIDADRWSRRSARRSPSISAGTSMPGAAAVASTAARELPRGPVPGATPSPAPAGTATDRAGSVGGRGAIGASAGQVDRRSGGASSSSSARPSAKRCRTKLSLRRVLEQPAHEVGHTGYQLAHGRVDAQAQTHALDGRLHRLGHPVEHLDLEAGVGDALLPRRR